MKSLALSPSVHHRRVLKDLQPEYSFGASTLSFKRWQSALRRRVSTLVAMPDERAPLRARMLWKRDHELGTIEKIAWTSEPGADVLGYLCLPKNAAPPYTTMVCLQGHTTGAHVSIGIAREDDGTAPIKEGDRDFGLQCMRHGLAALCIEQRSFGERREKHQQMVSPHGCHDAAMHALLLGRTLVGERVFDVERGLDYLETRKEINAKRIGVMGNSGGGVTAIYTAALLPRIAFAMPSCAFATFAGSFLSIYHCADNYVPGILKYAEHADVLGLFAPRPLVVVAGKDDDIFPMAATRRAFGDLQKIYRAAGAADNCRLVIGSGGHRFYAADAWPVLLKMIEDK